MNKAVYVLIAALVLILAWAAWSYFSVRGIEQPEYKVLEVNEMYEIRYYESMIVAETFIEEEDYSESLNEGFRRIANYIFGGNKKKEPIAMTAPVTEEVSERIAMTAPVTEEKESEKLRKVAFVMPSMYTMDTLPIPDDERVKLREVPARKVAVLTFGWYPTSARVEKKKQELIEILDKDGLIHLGEPIFAGYNPPFSFPLFFKNEVMLELPQ